MESNNNNQENRVRRIDEVWMAVSVDPADNTEGVCAAPLGHLGMVPLIAADEARLPWVIDNAKAIATMSGLTVKLIKLSMREELEEYKP